MAYIYTGLLSSSGGLETLLILQASRHLHSFLRGVLASMRVLLIICLGWVRTDWGRRENMRRRRACLRRWLQGLNHRQLPIHVRVRD